MTSPPAPMPEARLLFSLDLGVSYLNHGAFGAAPIPVQRTQQRLREEMESNPHQFFTVGLADRIAYARRHMATFLGGDSEGCAFVANVTSGVNLVLGSLPWRPGDEIVTTSHGYGAVDFAIDRICAATGAAHVTVDFNLTATDDEIVEAVFGALRPDRTRLLLIDHITSPTARVLPITRLIATARALAIPTMVDAAHAPGALPVDLGALGADFWVGNLHKWLFAPRPAAILSVAPEWRDRIRPAAVSWQDAAGFPGNLEMQGTLDYTSWLAAPTGLFVMRTLGVAAVRRHNSSLVAHGQAVIGAALGLTPAELPQPGAGEASMRVLPLPDGVAADPESANRLRQRIADELRVIVPITPWRGRGLLRLCAQVYNQPEEYERFAAGLPRVLEPVG